MRMWCERPKGARPAAATEDVGSCLAIKAKKQATEPHEWICIPDGALTHGLTTTPHPSDAAVWMRAGRSAGIVPGLSDALAGLLHSDVEQRWLQRAELQLLCVSRPAAGALLCPGCGGAGRVCAEEEEAG
eukprot:Hpha_TRINITY_DN9065_c0_g1::TRINITY_DN9065_c0_g1_i1::g.141841::m.141841